jgi:hypothetical protein
MSSFGYKQGFINFIQVPATSLETYYIFLMFSSHRKLIPCQAMLDFEIKIPISTRAFLYIMAERLTENIFEIQEVCSRLKQKHTVC